MDFEKVRFHRGYEGYWHASWREYDFDGEPFDDKIPYEEALANSLELCRSRVKEFIPFYIEIRTNYENRMKNVIEYRKNKEGRWYAICGTDEIYNPPWSLSILQEYMRKYYTLGKHQNYISVNYR